MIFRNTNFLFIREEIENNFKRSHLMLEPIFVDYLKKYNSGSLFTDISFLIKNNKSILYCPLTIENKDKKKILNFFGESFFIICKNKTKEIIELFYNEINDILLKEKIGEINFLFQKKIENFNLQNEINLSFFEKISNRKYIDLTLDLNSIEKNFSKGHKSAIKKRYEDLEYKVIDNSNYNNDILDMMKMHQTVSKKITRSRDTWLLNGEMIKNKNGLLIKVFYKKKNISSSLFFFNKDEALYFSSCTDRNYFKDFINITHMSIYNSIKYLKNFGCKKLTLGDCKTHYSQKTISEKEKNIEKFKSSFGGNNYVNFHLKYLHQNFLNLF
tara:strand:- start:371 stop:1354 length:984 start_codon:yes stop_codon:yes gene_type:complete